MEKTNKVQLFEDQPIRAAWDEEKEEWYFSIVDVVRVLTEQPTQRGASNYWAKTKQRMKKEGAGQLLTNCQQLRLKSFDDGKYYKRNETMDCQEKIKELRERTGMNRKEFCEHFGIPYQTVTDWERGQRKAPDYVLRLLEYYVRMHEVIPKSSS